MKKLYKTINTDSHGYLINPKDWNEDIAKIISKNENILLNEEHWEIIYFIRKFYFKYNTSPAIRMLVKAIKKKFGKKKGNSIYLFKLFPNGPAQQATKISGLPKPVNCL